MKATMSDIVTFGVDNPAAPSEAMDMNAIGDFEYGRHVVTDQDDR